MAANPDKLLLKAVLEGREAPGPVASCSAAERLAARLVGLDAAAATVRLEFTPGPDLTNGSGVILGGFVAAMLDMAMAFAVLAFTEVEHPGTIDLHTQFLRPVKPGLVHGDGRLLRAGRRILFAEATLTAADGRLLARGSASFTA